jgi:hypothetical protein
MILGLAAAARADVVIMQNGVKMEGVLGKDDDGNTTLEVSNGGFVVLDTATVVNIRTQTPAENAKIKGKWAKDEQAAADQDHFAAVQRAKGLVLYGDEWVTPSEFDRRLALDKLEVDRERAEHPEVRQVIITNNVQAHYHGGDVYGSAFARSRKLHYSYTTQPKYGASGNFIRKSEFSHSTSGHGGKYFDPSTGLYR